MRRWMVVVTVLLLVLAGVGIAVSAYHAGETHGVTQGIQEAGRGGNVVRVEDGRGFAPLGLFLFPLVFFGIFFLLRMAFWGGRWRGHGPGPGSGHWRGGRGRVFGDLPPPQHPVAGHPPGRGGW